MSTMRTSAIAAGVVVAAAAAVGVASMGVSQVAKPKAVQPVQQGSDTAPKSDKGGSAERDTARTADKTDRNVHVEAPRTSVDVQKDTGKVRVQAPYTDVKVDPGKGQVRVRAPYVDLNIRW